MTADLTTQAGCEVAILGGGLAGLTLAIQLKQRQPATAVTVLERRAHPVPEAAFKVGESTVEIGAHYFANVLGLREHLDNEQIRKFGFRFFFNHQQSTIEGSTELGVSQLLPTPSWQIDRGRFENFLGQHARQLGVEFIDGASITSTQIHPDSQNHQVAYTHDNASHQLQSRWLIDATGRAGLLKHKLDLAKPNTHDVNAVWWRVDGFVDINHWSDQADWLGRCTPPDRWRSTNHLCGPGYWVWLIPLASGAHSIGIVCDAKAHPLESMNSYDKAIRWLAEHQPQLAAALQNPQHSVQDFRFLRNFSYDCKQVFSADRWALTGESGLFLDPFYSPGSDFIAISNTLICDLIEKDRAGKPVAPYADIYQQLYFSFYENTLTLYQDQYAVFGDQQVMPLKVIWDYTYYWALLAPVVISDRLTNIALLGRLRPKFERGRALNLAIQAMLRDWSVLNNSTNYSDHRLLDQYQIDWFRQMNRELHDICNDATFEKRIAANVQRMEWLAIEILQQAKLQQSSINDHGLVALTADIKPSEVSLNQAWYLRGRHKSTKPVHAAVG